MGKYSLFSSYKKMKELAPDLLDFAIQVKYSLGGGCDPNHDAAPYSNQELVEMASCLIDKATEEDTE